MENQKPDDAGTPVVEEPVPILLIVLGAALLVSAIRRLMQK